MSKKTHLSSISAMHYSKLVGRSLLLIVALVCYILHKVGVGGSVSVLGNNPYFMGTVCVIFLVEMILRFFPSRHESMGCQKQFGKNFKATAVQKPANRSPWPVFFITLAWLGLNGAIGVLYFTKVIDVGILFLICLAYSVCDMICILFFCPFQTWFMKNKCCATCRIYNWDFAMMFTPLVFVPQHPYTWILLGTSLLLLIFWEVALIVRPERFSEETNGCLSCASCREKLCQHKKQLHSFHRKHYKACHEKRSAEHGIDRQPIQK